MGTGGGGMGPQNPWQRFRARLDSIPSAYIFWGIIGLNGAIFLTWNYAYVKVVSESVHLSFLLLLTAVLAAKYS